MFSIARIVRQQYLGALSLLLVVSAGAYAATGDPLKLGLLNKANLPTIVQNTEVGPALELRARRGQPPLKVNSTRLVPRLNAAKVGGRPAGAFALKSGVYSMLEADQRFLEDTGPKLLKLVSTRGQTGTLLETTVNAPAAGNLVLLATGAHFNAGGAALYLTVGAYTVPNLCPGGVESCSSVASQAVTAGESVAVKVVFSGLSAFEGVLLLFFEPA